MSLTLKQHHWTPILYFSCHINKAVEQSENQSRKGTNNNEPKQFTSVYYPCVPPESHTQTDTCYWLDTADFTLHMQSFSSPTIKTLSHTHTHIHWAEEKKVKRESVASEARKKKQHLFLTRFSDVNPRVGKLWRRSCSVAVANSNRDLRRKFSL